MTRTEDQERKKQIAAGAGILLVLTAVVCAAIYGWRLLPGLLGEWVGTMVGIMTTPFILEASFVILGFVIVIAINAWRRQREGDELVYLEQVNGADLPANLPDQARWAVFRENLPPGERPDVLVRLDGALEIGDFASAAELLAEMDEAELRKPEVLRLRLKMARLTGRGDLAAELERQINGVSSNSE
jgi:hypothetical protein